MPALTQTPTTGPGQRIATPNTLTASDTFSYTYGNHQLLVLFNPTGGSISPNVKGDTSWSPPTPGAEVTTGVGAGWTGVAIASGDMRVLNLDEMSAYLSDVVTITSGAGLVAIVLGA